MAVATDDVLLQLQQQSRKFESARGNMEIGEINIKNTPNLYAKAMAWDTALEKTKFSVIQDMKEADRNGEYENSIGNVLHRFDSALHYALKYSQGNLHPSHQVLCELGTRNSGLTKPPLNLLLPDKTWTEYFHNMNTIVLLILRLYDTGNVFHQQTTLPQVKFTDKQVVALNDCLTYNTTKMDKNNENELNVCHWTHLRFLLVLLDQDIGRFTYECPLICAVVMLSVDKTAFVSAKYLSSKIAGIATVFRMLLAYNCVDRCRNEPKIKTEEEWAIENAIHYLHINNSTYRSNPCRELLKSLSTIFNIAISLSSEPNLSWSQDKNTVTYMGKFSISMLELCQCVKLAQIEAKSILVQLLGYSDLPDIPDRDVEDNPSNLSCGFSFLKDQRNVDWVQGETYFKRIYETKKSWWNANREINLHKVESFAKLIDDFLSILFPLIHVTGGAPPRGTELVNITLENPTSCIRNIFIENGYVHIRTIYTKTMVQRSQFKPVSRFLPQEVGQLVIYYAWLILPFWRSVKGMSTVGETIPSPFLFVKDVVSTLGSHDVLWDTRKLSKCLQDFFGRNVTVQSYRQIAVSIFHKKLQTTFDTDDNDNADQLIDLQAAHTTLTAQKNYAQVVNQDFDSYFEVSLAWHSFLNSSAFNSTDDYIQNVSGGGGGGGGSNRGAYASNDCFGVSNTFGRISGVGNDTFVVGVGNTFGNTLGAALAESGTILGMNTLGVGNTSVVGNTLVVGNSLGIGVADSGYCGNNVAAEIYGNVECVDIESLCGDGGRDAFIDMELPIIPNVQDAPGRVISTLTVDSHNHYLEDYNRRVQYQCSLSAEKMTTALRQILKHEKAEFRGNQLPTLQAIMQREYQCVVQICGTGIGKTASFLLPVKLSPGGLTIVVTPLTILNALHCSDAKRAGINAVIWDATTPHLMVLPELLFISHESFETQEFTSYLNPLVYNYRLERIFFDECHEIVTSGRGFRPKMISLIPVVKGTGVLTRSEQR